jgi:hypothetical protein
MFFIVPPCISEIFLLQNPVSFVRYYIMFIQLLPDSQKSFHFGMGKNFTGFAPAHPARAMYFTFCKTPGFPPRPGEDIFFSAKSSENANLFIDNTRSL